MSRREALRLGLVGVGGLVIGAGGGYALARTFTPIAEAPHPIVGSPTLAPAASRAFPIVIADGDRGFVDADGAPFLYLADTPWNAISRMTRESFTTLATARRDTGFTALQMSVLDFDPKAENAYGHAPFTGRGALDSPALADEGDDDYWTHVEWCVDTCAELGLVACLVPSWYGGWGDAWRGYVTMGRATSYASFLAERLGDRENVWWLLGGDNEPGTDGNATVGVPSGLDHGARVDETIAMGQGLREGASVAQLMSYHTERTRTVEEYFGAEDWYEISAAYSDAYPVSFVTAEYEREVVRPVVLWEAYYDARDRDPMLDRRQLRGQSYHALLSGAAGVSYGHELVWPVLEGWVEALDADSAADVKVLASMLAQYGEGGTLVPVAGATASLLPDGFGTPGTASEVSAALMADDAGALVYFGEPRTAIQVDTTALDATAVYAFRWFNPATGEEFFVADNQSGTGVSVGWPSTWSDAVLIMLR